MMGCSGRDRRYQGSIVLTPAVPWQVSTVIVGFTYSFCFFFGPGLPRTFGVAAPSVARAAAPRLVPAFAPAMDFRFPPGPAPGGASELDGVLVPLAASAAMAESEGLLDGIGSMAAAAGVSGDEDGFRGVSTDGRATCGNLMRWSGESLSTTVRDLAILLGVDIFRVGITTVSLGTVSMARARVMAMARVGGAAWWRRAAKVVLSTGQRCVPCAGAGCLVAGSGQTSN